MFPILPRSLAWFGVGFLLVFLLSSCVTVPDEVQFTHNGAALSSCERDLAPASAEGEALAASGFTLSTWNIYKGQLPGWREDLDWLLGESDILLLQESHLEPQMLTWLVRNQLDWSMAHAFTYRSFWTGVLTAGKVPQRVLCAQRLQEPYLRLPKTVLISYFPLEGSRWPLLVVNMHGINFTPDSVPLAEQLRALGKVVAEHPGPVVLAGDLNTWTRQRMQRVDELAYKHGLQRAEFRQSPSLHFGSQVDHVYYRGLRPLRSRVIRVRSSDHYPLVVTFEKET